MNSIFALEDEDLNFLDEEELPLKYSKESRVPSASSKESFKPLNQCMSADSWDSKSKSKCRQYKFRVCEVNQERGTVQKKHSDGDISDKVDWSELDEDLNISTGLKLIPSCSEGGGQGLNSKTAIEVLNTNSYKNHLQGIGGIVGDDRSTAIPSGDYENSKKILEYPDRKNGMRISQRVSEGKSIESCSDSSSPTIVPSGSKRKFAKRRFPGPAGALPQLENVSQLGQSDGKALDILKYGKQSNGLKKVNTGLRLLEASDPDDFKKPFWLKLQKDSIDTCRGLIYHTILSIHRKATENRLPKGKVPLMCALIKSFAANCTDASVILRDPTGEIKGTLHQQVLEQYQPELVSGAGISLKQASVFSPSARKHYVNITPSNILYLINPNGKTDFSCEGSSQTFSLGDPSTDTSRKHKREIPEQLLDLETEKRSSEDVDHTKEVTDSIIEDALDDVLLDMDEDEDLLASVV